MVQYQTVKMHELSRFIFKLASLFQGPSSGMDTRTDSTDPPQKSQDKNENSDCGYGTQLENQDCASASSDEYEPCKIVHAKRRNPKQKPNTKMRAAAAASAAAGPQGASDRKRKRIIKRAKTTMYVLIHIALPTYDLGVKYETFHYTYLTDPSQIATERSGNSILLVTISVIDILSYIGLLP